MAPSIQLWCPVSTFNPSTSEASEVAGGDSNTVLANKSRIHCEMLAIFYLKMITSEGRPCVMYDFGEVNLCVTIIVELTLFKCDF